ncbi:hypothetical protein ACFWBB_10570 [Streptomyces sp. NPDC060000]|uniref:hypothetical protein n=1 Tax=Streptomyces sp. NPDC060000 TaxID=3347031 RepID=UPI0036B93A20
MTREVPPGRKGLRLVFGRPPRLGAAFVARRLAGRLDRTVIVADGTPLPTSGGGLFIAADHGPGWVRCVPGAPEAFDSRRFPKPAWESALPGRPWRLSAAAVAEPLPAGVWLRPAEENAAQHDHRTRLSARLGVSSELITMVVGVPGSAALPLADVARFWETLAPHVRQAVRLVCYGPTRLSGGRNFGDVLAQVLGQPVRLYNGMPQQGDDSGDVLLVGDDGSPGRPLRAHEFTHMPPTGTGSPRPSFAAVHRWPLGDLPEIGPGTHLLTEDVVVEVVRSGLWVRRPQDPPHAAEVRTADPHPGHERILCDAQCPEALPRLRRLADDLVRRFPPELRGAVRVGVCRPAVPASGRTGAAAVPQAARPPSPDRSGPLPGVVGRSLVPGGSGPVPSGEGAGQVRPHTAPGVGHQGLVSLAAEVLRRHPELTAGRPDPDAVAGLAAVLRRLAGGEGPDGPGTQTADRVPEPPDRELLGRGLRLLPVHHGATGLRATLDEAMRQWYAGQPLLVDADVCEASVRGPRDDPGNTDFLIWSVRGRRTDLLDPLSPDRVLFLPGSRFRVLEAAPDIPGVVMMREIDPETTQRDGELDRAAVRELTRALRDWRGGTGA